MSKLAAFLRRGAPACRRRLRFWEPFPRRRRSPAPRYTRRSCPSAATPTAGGGSDRLPRSVHGGKVVTGVDLGVGDFKKPNDMFASADG